MQNYLELAQEQIKRGKNISLVKDSVRKHLEQEIENKFYSDMKAEYDGLYKTKEIIETILVFDEILNKEVEKTEVVGFDYIEDAPTFEQYKNETIVVQDAVYEDDMLVSPEITELLRPYQPIEITDDMIEAKLIEIGYDYKAKRAREYPPLEEQLDMIYKDIDSWKALIAGIKERNPKWKL